MPGPLSERDIHSARQIGERIQEGITSEINDSNESSESGSSSPPKSFRKKVYDGLTNLITPKGT